MAILESMAWAVGGWTFSKVVSLTGQAFIDKPLKDQIKKKGQILYSEIKEATSPRAISVATRQELSRAICLAFAKAGSAILYELDRWPQVEFSKEAYQEHHAFIKRVQAYLGDIERQALSRETAFENIFEDDINKAILSTLPEEFNDNILDLKPIYDQATDAFVKWLRAKEGQDIPELLRNFLLHPPSDSKHISFGACLLDSLAEILKNGTYPEASTAYNQYMDGNLAQMLAELKEEHGQKLDKITEHLDADVTINLDAKHSAEQNDTSFTDMVFSQRRTKFVGREGEWAQLMAFLEENKFFSWWQISGAGGHGKSRLGLHLADKMREDYGWHTGFLDDKNLQKLLEGRIEFHRPTLCIIDYATSPAKAQKLVEAIYKLHQRMQATKKGNKNQPILQAKVRFLILERVGFNFDETTNSTFGLNWLHQFGQDQKHRPALRDSVYRPESALSLGPLTAQNMLSVARNWRSHLQKSKKSEKRDADQYRALTEAEENHLLEILKSRDGESWRPLFAMLYASLTENLTSPIQDISLTDLFEKVIDQEAREFWKDPTGNLINPSPQAHNIACLATMTGSVTRDELDSLDPTEGDKAFFGDPDDGEDIFGAEACYLLGYTPGTTGDKAHDYTNRLFLARQPDLLGEYLVLWSLKGFLPESNKNRKRALQKRVPRLVEFAARHNLGEFLSFLIRLQQDYPDNPATKALISTQLPEELFTNLPELFASHLLVASAQAGLLGLLKTVLNQKIDPNHVDEKSGIFPLLMATQNGHTNCVHTLLEKGANPNQTDPETGIFPLLLAIQNGYVDCAQLLIKQNAEIDKTHPSTGASPLIIAIETNQIDCVKLLLKGEANPNLINQKNTSNPLSIAAQEGNVTILKLLLKSGAHPDPIDNLIYRSPLTLAAQEGFTDCVALLLKYNADPNRIDSRGGLFPLILAAQNGHANSVELLLEKGANPNQTHEQSGNFPLLLAAHNGHADSVKLLLEKDAGPNQIHKQDGTFPLLMAAQEGHADSVRLLLEKGAEPNQINEQGGIFPLLMAAQVGHVECVELLLEKGVNPNQIHKQNGVFPLLMAAQVGHVECVKALLEKGADPNQINIMNQAFPLLISVIGKHIECVKLLLDHEANVNQMTLDGKHTALMLAEEYGHTEIADLLREYGAVDMLQQENVAD